MEFNDYYRHLGASNWIPYTADYDFQLPDKMTTSIAGVEMMGVSMSTNIPKFFTTASYLSEFFLISSE